jgi:hypothetical protein
MTTDKQWEDTLNSPESVDMLGDMALDAMREAEEQMQQLDKAENKNPNNKNTTNHNSNNRPDIEPGKVETNDQPEAMPAQTPTEIEPHTKPIEKQDEKA